jgi:hypothetical protein
MNDKHLRAALLEDLRLKYEDEPDTELIEELSIAGGSTRADLTLVNGIIHGFEIKSDRDSLSRLADQAHAYTTVFDHITLLVGEKHVREAVDMIPSWWGVRVARYQGSRIVMRDLKYPLSNPAIDPLAVAGLLWREEAVTLLEEFGNAAGMYSKPKATIFMKLIETIEFDILRARVRQRLRLRAGSRSGEKRA